MSKWHVKKSWPMFFNDVVAGIRTSDIRFEGDCEKMHAGDVLELHEWDPVTGQYTGNVQACDITYEQRNKSNPCAISNQALANDYVVLSIKPRPARNERS